jgi:hypothetical protein
MDPDSGSAPPRVSDRRRPSHALAGAVGLILLVACGDPYLHTNPYDPAHPVQFAFAGPDTLFSLAEIAHYTVATNPPFSDTSFTWGTAAFMDPFIPPPLPPACGNQFVSGDTALKRIAPGTYESILPPLEPYTFTIAIAVSVGAFDTVAFIAPCGSAGVLRLVRTTQFRQTGYKSVVVTQRVVRIQLRCPDTHACAPLSVGDSAFVWVDGFDALGNEIAALTLHNANPASGNPPLPIISPDTAIARAQATNNPVVTYVSRDSTIARATPIGIRVARVTPLKAGSTWVVATRGALFDSLQIVVH